jgi:hypothetical protein
VVLLREGGLPPGAFVAEYLGELYAAWRWLEREPSKGEFMSVCGCFVCVCVCGGGGVCVLCVCVGVGVCGWVGGGGGGGGARGGRRRPGRGGGAGRSTLCSWACARAASSTSGTTAATRAGGRGSGAGARRAPMRLGASDEFFNISLERPHGDSGGYDVLFVNVRGGHGLAVSPLAPARCITSRAGLSQGHKHAARAHPALARRPSPAPASAGRLQGQLQRAAEPQLRPQLPHGAHGGGRAADHWGVDHAGGGPGGGAHPRLCLRDGCVWGVGCGGAWSRATGAVELPGVSRVMAGG